MPRRAASVAGLLVLVTAGCGSARAGAPRAPTLPRSLARTWATRADAVAAAAAAGETCRAKRLAAALRSRVIEAGASIPAKLRVPLLSSVNSLANRLTCEPPPPTTVTVEQPPPPGGHGPPHGHGHHKGPGPKGRK